MLALAYQNLPDIDDAPPLDADDLQCIEEIREVLKRRNRLDRFGVTLLHTHFPMAEDEVMVESCDNDARTLTM